MNKTLWIAFLCVPALISTASGAKEQPKPNPVQASMDLITQQEIQLLQQDIRDKRRQIVAANMPLDTEESAKFWPVYDQYIADLSKILDLRFAKIKDYATQYTTLSDQQAADYVSQLIDTDKAITELRVKYRTNFEKVLSKKKAAMFTQLDRRIQLLIDIQRANAIPLISPK